MHATRIRGIAEEKPKSSESRATPQSAPSGSGSGAGPPRSSPSKPEGSSTGDAPPEGAGAGASTGAPKKPDVPEPNLPERMEGLQGWMAEIERKQRRMTYFGAAGILLAALAACGALVLSVMNRNDAATKEDFDALQQQVQGTQQSVKQATEEQLKGVNETLGSLDQRIEDLKKKQGQNAADIARLQNRVDSLSAQGAGGGGGGGGGGGL